MLNPENGYYAYKSSDLQETANAPENKALNTAEPVRPYPPYPGYGNPGSYYQVPAAPASPPAQATPVAQAEERAKPKRARRFVKTAATMVAVMAISGASGASGAWYMMKNFAPEAVVQVESPASPLSPVTPAASVVYSDAGYGSITEVVKKAAGSVVEIMTESKQTSYFTGQYVTQGAGSGVILSADGYIVTNDHVVDGAISVTVRTQDGKEYVARLIGTDSQTDLAVIKIEAEGLTPVTVADSSQVEVGQLAVAIGNPLGELGGTVTSGIISAKDREITIQGETMTLLQTSAAVNPGNSGGGLFDQNGNLVGVVNAKSAGSEIEGLAFAIPSNTVKEVTDDLISGGYVTGRPQFGISVVEVNDIRMAMQLGVNEPGVYVQETMADNNLEKLDRIITVDGWKVNVATDLTDILGRHKVGDTLSVTVKRAGQEVTVQVTLTEKVPERVRQPE